MNVLLRMQCSSDRNKGRLVVAKFGEYRRCGRTPHANNIILGWGNVLQRVSLHCHVNEPKLFFLLFVG